VVTVQHGQYQSRPLDIFYPPSIFTIYIPKTIFILSSYLLGLSRGRFLRGFTTKNVYAFRTNCIPPTCPTHRSLLDFVILTILGGMYKPQSSSLCNRTHPKLATPWTPSLGAHISLSNFSNTCNFCSLNV
jgi:hypothetical protein